MTAPRRLVLSEDADADIDAILLWTLEHFGTRQANVYHERITATLEALAQDPFKATSKDREHDLGPGYRSLHLGRRSRHLVIYSVEDERVLIARILHDGMDPARHLPE